LYGSEEEGVSWADRLPEADRERLKARRYRVIVAAIDGRQFAYYVCSCLDERKALVIATEFHHRNHPSPEDRIYEVVEVVGVDGEGPQNIDLCDRAEW
jgi:hypothetical protein